VDSRTTLPLAILIVLVFAWRFARTRQLYITSLAVRRTGIQPEPFNPRDPRILFEQALMGRRSIEPSSFFIRGLVLAAVALCLLPFRQYEPALWWLVLLLLGAYLSWCVAHGVLLKRAYGKGDAK